MEKDKAFDFFQLSNDQCLSLYSAITDNGTALLRISKYCSESNDFGVARALAILGCEEWIKGTLLLLKGKGLLIHINRELTSAIKKSHEKRHDLASMVQILITVQHLIVSGNPDTNTVRHDRLFSFISKALNAFAEFIEMRDVIDWWEQAETFKQRGFYVDYENGLLKPLDVSREEYETAIEKVETTIQNLKFLTSKVQTELTPKMLSMINEGLRLNETMRQRRLAEQKQKN